MDKELKEDKVSDEPTKNSVNTAVSYSSSGGTTEGSPISENDLDALFDYYEKKFEKQDSKIENQKLTIIETLGIFVALFTFISVDFQVFKSYRNPYAIGGLSLILLGSISFLLVIFDFYILEARAINNDSSSKYKNKYFFSSIWERCKNNPFGITARIVLFVFSIIFIFVGLIVFSVTPMEKLEDDKDQIKKEVLSSVQLDLNNQKNELEKINNDNGVLIKNTNDSVAKFKECIRDFGFTYKCFKD